MALATLLNPSRPAVAEHLLARPGDEVRLTAYLAMFVATLVVRGDEGDIRIPLHGRLRPLFASDPSALRRAEAYLKVHGIDGFLAQLPPLLDTDARLCLLLNVCDALLADELMPAAREARFNRLLVALGQSKVRFKPYADAIAIKNGPSCLGNFDEAPPADRLMPPMALVAALVYLLVAEGGMERADMHDLGTRFGASEALLGAAWRYAARVRVPQFLETAPKLLDERQRLALLLNVSDLMMRGRVTDSERSLFRRMRSAMGFEGRAFDPYLNLVLLKNELPREDGKRSPEATVFDRKYQWAGEGAQQKADAEEKRNAPQSTAGLASQPASIDKRIARVRAKTRQLSSALEAEDVNASSSNGVPTQSAAAQASPAANGPADLRAYRDAQHSGSKAGPGAASAAGVVLAPAGEPRPGKRRVLVDTAGAASGRHLIDERSAFDSEGRGSAAGPPLGRTIARMDAVGDRTRTLSRHIEAVRSATSLAEASEIPALPAWEPEWAAREPQAKNDVPLPEATPESASTIRAVAKQNDAHEAQDQDDSAATGRLIDPLAAPASEPLSESMNGERGDLAARDEGTAFPMLAANEGGPFVNLDTAPASRDDIALNRALRRFGVLLLPVLLLIYGTTLVCEMLSGQAFVENGNLANEARIVHRIASLQHSLHQLAPDSSGIVATAAAFGAGESQVSDHDKASRFLEQRKDELAAALRRHESASAIAAERQHWFATAKSVVMLGLGLALWGMLFRSKRMLHVSAMTGMASMLVCANGYWLWLRF